MKSLLIAKGEGAAGYRHKGFGIERPGGPFGLAGLKLFVA
jgi:hypothetical protein